MVLKSWEAAGEVRWGWQVRLWVSHQFCMWSKMFPWVAMYLVAVRMFCVFCCPKVLVSMLVIWSFFSVCSIR